MCGFCGRKRRLCANPASPTGQEVQTVHLRGCTATVDTILRWCLSARCQEKPCAETVGHGLPSEVRPKGERRMVSRIFTSWNQLDEWLRQLDGMRLA